MRYGKAMFTEKGVGGGGGIGGSIGGGGGGGGLPFSIAAATATS